MSTPATSHVDPLFVPIFGESIELLRKVLLTKDAQPFVVAGSGTLGWDMMVNLIERDDEVLVVNTGYFGDHFGEW
jgi:alanine-glyoxylate transaminase/serine-glyoxylate transaminase/serine-pyruvate transaminase